MNTGSKKRSNNGIFSPVSPVNQRMKMDYESEQPTAAMMLLNTEDKGFDLAKLKEVCHDLPEWTNNFVVYIANVIAKSIKDDVNVGMDFNHNVQMDMNAGFKKLLDKSLSEIRAEMKGMETHINMLQAENKTLKQKLVDQEAYSRRSNLIINGIPERRGQNLFTVFESIAKYELDLQKDISVERIHRVGPPPRFENQAPRPIIVRFSNFQDRQLVWHNRNRRDPRNLDPRNPSTPPKFSIIEDFPPSVVEARKRLLPIAYEAYNVHNMQATVKVDKLIIDSQTYDIDSLDKLPQCLIPISKSFRETDKQVAFFRKYCPLSNHSPANIKLKDRTYNCSEQLFLSEKCYSYGHKEAGDNIRALTDPGLMVQAAKVCQGFNAEWEENQFDVMLTAQLAKYTQNDDHKNFLMSTGDKVIVEGSPYDTTWGVGIVFSDPAIDDEKNWKGDNLLGQALMITRRLLRPQPPRPVAPVHVAPNEESLHQTQGFNSTEPSTSYAAAADIHHTQGFDPHHDPNNENLRPT